MAHYFESGFSVRKPAWHGLGTVTDEYPENWAQARKLAGLEWEPRALATVKATLPDGMEIDLPDYRLVVRDDTWAPLGITSDDHELVGNRTMGEIIEEFLGLGVKFETGGSLRGGRNVWALAYLDEPHVVAGDDSETFPYLAIINAHDGSGACRILYTRVRIVCWNTYSLAERSAQHSYTFRHTTGVAARVAEAKAALNGLRADADSWDKTALELFSSKLTDEDRALTHFMAEWEPTSFELREKANGGPLTDRQKENVEKGRRAFRSIYLDSVTIDAHRGTALGLVDTATEYLDHVAGRQAGRLSRMLLGDPRKAQALTLARRVAR